MTYSPSVQTGGDTGTYGGGGGMPIGNLQGDGGYGEGGGDTGDTGDGDGGDGGDWCCCCQFVIRNLRID